MARKAGHGQEQTDRSDTGHEHADRTGSWHESEHADRTGRGHESEDADRMGRGHGNSDRGNAGDEQTDRADAGHVPAGRPQPDSAHAGGVSHRRAFAIGIGLNVAFVAVEIVYGLIANSSALLADAGHNASDVLSLAFAWTAAWMATIKPRGKYTYGLRKTTVLVSILNALMLFGAVAFIAWDAAKKLQDPVPVAGDKVMIVAGIGVVINTLTALLFMKGQRSDLNIRGAFLHMAADAGVSLGVVAAGLLINLTGKTWIDPVTSFIIIAVIVWGTWRLFTDSIDLALDAVPKHIKVEEVRDFLLSREGVEDLHDLHIWGMSTTQIALTAHLIMPGGHRDDFLRELQDELRDTFGIGHTTFQIEEENIEECYTDC